MGGEQAAGVLAAVTRESKLKKGLKVICCLSCALTLHRYLESPSRDDCYQWSDEDEQKMKKPIIDRYEEEGHPYYSSARLWDDGVIQPEDTRFVLAMGLSAAANAPSVPTRYGVFRM